MKRIFALAFAIWVTMLSFHAGPARAQATRTWVSGLGDDANPCSRTAPCKTFAGAISKTASGGEIDVLDPGGFGAVTITKAITIDGGGTFASVLSPGTNGIIVSAGAADKIVLRNLSISGGGTGLNGISFVSGGHLIVENCAVMGFTTSGILVAPAAASQATISHASVENNAAGILFSTASNSGGINGAVSNSTILYNTGAGISALVPTGKPGMAVTIDHVVSAFNSIGISASGNGATVLLGNSTVVGNVTGVSQVNTGGVLSYKNNQINASGSSDGTPLTGISLN